MTKIVTILLAVLLISCATLNYDSKIARRSSIGDQMTIHSIEYYCSEVCFKDACAFFTGKFELNTHTGDITCHCRSHSKDCNQGWAE